MAHKTGGFPCTIGDMAPGQILTLTITANVPADYIGPDPMTSTAAVSTSTLDADPANNAASSRRVPGFTT